LPENCLLAGIRIIQSRNQANIIWPDRHTFFSKNRGYDDRKGNQIREIAIKG